MPYKPPQARAVLANTSPSNPRHKHARAKAKQALKGTRVPKKRGRRKK